MRKIITLLLAIGTFGCSLAQTLAIDTSWFRHVVSAHHLTYWFDEDRSTATDMPLGQSTALIDASGLALGMHTLHCYAVDSAGGVYPTRSALFFCPPAPGTDSTVGQAVVYWFDEDYEHRQSTSLQGGAQLIDASELDLGVHTLHCYVLGNDGTAYPTRSAMFFCPPATGNDSTVGQAVVYWFDEDYGHRQSTSPEGGALMMEVSELTIGMHTLHCYVMGNDGTVYPTSSVMFYRPPYVNTDSVEAQAVVCWFDEDYENRVTSPQGGELLMDVSGLTVGMHTLHSYAMGIDGTAYPTRSAMFFRPPATGNDSTAAQELVYWFDEDYAHRQSTSPQGGELLMDVSGLTVGMHTLHSYVVGIGGTAYPTRSAMFFRPVAGSESGHGIFQYYYWLNDDFGQATRIKVDTVTEPFQWYGLLPIDTLPFRSSFFHFEIDAEEQPHAYAKNTFHTLFTDEVGRFVMGEVKSFVDQRVSQPVVSDTILPNTTERFAKVTNNNIKWFRLTAQTGDSLAFRSDQPCTLQLFDPTGEEVYRASNDTATHMDGTHAWHDGTYYLAVHNATYTGNSNLIVEYQNISKYCVLEYTPHSIGNKIHSQFVMSMNGNGFEHLESVWINHNSRKLYADTIFSVARTKANALFTIQIPYPNALYDIYCVFRDSIEYDTILISQAFALDSAIEGEIRIGFNAPAWQVKPFPIVVTIENTGNLDYSYIPFNIAFEHPELIDFISFGNFGIYHTPYVDSSNYSFVVLSKNLLGKHVDGGMMFFFIPELKAFEKKDYVLQFYCPDHARFNLYAWTGAPLEFDERYQALIAAPPQYNNCDQTSVTMRDEIEKSSTFDPTQTPLIVNGSKPDKATKLARNMLGACDVVENVQNVVKLPNPIDRAATATRNTVKTGVTVAGIYNALDHNGDMARLKAYGIDPDDPLYEEIANLHPPIATPAEIAGDGPLGRLLELFGHCPEQPTPDPGTPYPVFIANPGDPNDIFGYVAESGSRYIRKGIEEIVYRIEFENDPVIALAPAHTIIVKDTLDRTVFDLPSFRASNMKLGSKTLNFGDAQSGIQTIDMRPSINVIVQVQLQYDSTTGIITWTITSLDPTTLEPTNYLQPGVLPVNIDGSGEGNVTFRIGVKTTLTDGVNVSNQAHIIFDQEAPIATPIWINIMDTVAPTSRIAYGESKADSLMLSFAGSDNRSGVWRYDLYGRADTMDAWHIVASDIENSVYAYPQGSDMADFYVVAIDSAGNREDKTPQVEYNTSRGVVGPTITTYQIRFVNYDNTELCSYHLPVGATPAYLGSTPLRNADAHYSYRFKGWTPTIIPVVGNTVYHAMYDSIPNRYRISFFDYDSTLLQSDSLPYGAMPSYYSTIPTRAEVDSFVYAFVGWTPALTPVTGDAEYRPVFDSMKNDLLPRYLVTFRDWNDSVLQWDSVTFGTIPYYWGMEPRREGNAYCDYRFIGWRPMVKPVTDSITYRALYDTLVHTHIVTFVNINGAVLQQDTLPYGSMPVYRGETPARRATMQYAYTFAGWSPRLDTVRNDIVYTATYDSTIHCHPQYHDDYITSCEEVMWRGRMYNETGTYTQVVEGAANGCDSIYTLHLTVNHSSSGDTTATACDAFVWHGVTYTASTDTATYVTTNATDCDSTVTLHLTVNHSSNGDTTATACDAFVWHGVTYTASTNTPTYVTTNAAGCDSTVTLHLTVNHSSNSDTTATACDAFTWHGTTYTASTDTPTFVTTNAADCDSTVTLHLIINHSSSGDTSATACDAFVWHGVTYTASTNTATFVTTNAADCDSTVTLHLTVNHSSNGDTTATACDAFVWHGVTYTASTNTPTFVTTNAADCDSTVTLHLTINHSTSGDTTATACDAFVWHGVPYTASTDTPTFVTTNAADCDSTVTLHLIINHSSNGDTTATACDAFVWHGVTYTASTDTPTFVTTNAADCDSTVTLHLTVNHSTSGDTTATACDAFVWHGVTYTASTDTATFVTTNAADCDSTVTLHLTVNRSVDTTVRDSATGSYSWHGMTYTESGTYQWQGTTLAGCDSTVTLILVIGSTGIDDVGTEGVDVTVYPNPTTGLVTIGADDVVEVEVYDPAGRRVSTHRQTHVVDLGDLPSGVYTLKILLQRGTSLQRVILR